MNLKKIREIQLNYSLIWLIVLGLVAGFLIFGLFFRAAEEFSQSTKPVKLPVKASRWLDGRPVAGEAANLIPAVVVIENHLDARPPAGLAEAKVVYEVLVEGWITRFLAIYDLSEPLEVLGPIRSARPYLIELAAEYRGLFVHSGGSPAALKQLKSETRIFDLNEFFGFNTGYFYRRNDRRSPHNLYTSGKLLKLAKQDYQLPQEGDFSAWTFKTARSWEVLKSFPEALEISLDYSPGPDYQIVWEYQPEIDCYFRNQNQAPHLEDSGRRIKAKNIIIQFVSTKVLDELGRREINLEGEGRTIVFRNGRVIEGVWKKDNTLNRTFFLTGNQEKIPFEPGTVWLEIVPDYLKVFYF